jgi:hypothetical protein
MAAAHPTGPCLEARPRFDDDVALGNQGEEAK